MKLKEFKHFSAIFLSLQSYIILFLFVSSVFSASKPLSIADIKDTTCWKLHLYSESDVPYTCVVDPSGVTYQAAKRSEHEYDASVGTPCSLQVNTTYTIQLRVRSDSSDQISVGFTISKSPWFPLAIRTIKLSPQDSTYTLRWVVSKLDLFGASFSETFLINLGKTSGKITFSSISISGSPANSTDTNDFKCPVAPKLDAVIGDPSTLPDGYMVFCDQINPGIYVTSLKTWKPVLIGPADTVYTMSLSDDGKWVLYRYGSRANIQRIDGKFKSTIESPNSVSITGFVRNSPYGNEIFYDNLIGHNYLYAVQASLSDSEVNTGTRRVLARIGPYWEFERYYRLLVCKDQIWGDIHPLINNVPKLRTGFLTIPDSGRGIATAENIYKFKNDDLEEMWGCNHAMSQDGKYCLAIPGNAGETGNFCHCPPPAHAGFFITRFYHDHDSAVDLREYVHKYAISLNWCPKQYRLSIWSEVDFANYNFSNNNTYVAATQTGTISPRKGLWVVDWEKNVWYPVSPDSCKIEASTVAMFIGSQNNQLLSNIIPDIDTGSVTKPAEDPIGYKVLQPSGGELFHPGEQCTVKVVSKDNGNAKILLKFGKISTALLDRAINPRVDSIFVVTIPQYFLSEKLRNGETVYDTIRPISTQCKIVVEHYITGIAKSASSEGYFSIAPIAAVHSQATVALIKRQVRFSSSSIATVLSNSKLSRCTSLTIYDCMGRTIVQWNSSYGTSFPKEALLKYKNLFGFYLIKAEYLENGGIHYHEGLN